MTTASIVTYHTPVEELTRLLECASASRIDRIYIVDNSRHDLLREFVIGLPGIKYIHSENIGYGGAHNIAIREAIRIGAKYHIVLNPDIRFEPQAVDELVRYMEAYEDVGQVMPKVFYPDGRLQYLCKMIPTPMDLIFKRFLPARFTRSRLRKFQLQFTGYDRIMNVPYLSGCFMFFRVAALKKIGLFDERFFMYPEDVDITRRIHAYYRTVFYPGVSIVHAHAAASRTDGRMLRIHVANMIKYFNKWGWVFDSERKKINKELLKKLHYDE